MKKTIRLIMTIALVFAMIVTAAAQLPDKVYAAGNTAADIQVGDLVKVGNDNPTGLSGTPLWRVLDRDDTDGSLFLMSEYLWTGNGGSGTYDSDALIQFNSKASAMAGTTPENEWTQITGSEGESTARKWCREIFKPSVLDGINGLTIKQITETDENITINDKSFVPTKRVLDEVFFLSAAEVNKYLTSKDARKAYKTSNDSSASKYWLRSAQEYGNLVGIVNTDGSITSQTANQRTNARPAFWALFDANTSFTSTESDGKRIWTIGDDSAEPEKPAIKSIDIDDFTYAYMSGEEQPAQGGVYAWVIEFADDVLSDANNEDLKMQKKTDDGSWEDSSESSAKFEINDNGTWVIATVPDNTEAVAKQWRFVYAGGGVECPAITQAAKEAVESVNKTELVSAISEAGNAIVAVSEDGKDVSPSDKWTTAEAKEAFEQAIADAQTVLDNTDATQKQVDAAVAALSTAKTTYEAAKKDGKAISVIISRDGDDEFQPASGGQYAWIAIDQYTGDIHGKVTAADFKLRTKKSSENEWKDATMGTLNLTNADDGAVRITADIPDNTDTYDKDWSIVYIGSDPSTQSASCESIKYTQEGVTEQVDAHYISLSDKFDSSKSFEVKEVPWNFEEYQNDRIPPIYIATVDPTASVVFMQIQEHGFKAEANHSYVSPWTYGGAQFEGNKSTYELSCTSGSGGEASCNLGRGDLEDNNNVGIANMVQYWESAIVSDNIPEPASLYEKLAPYALNADNPEKTYADLLWVKGAATNENFENGVKDYILVIIYAEPIDVAKSDAIKELNSIDTSKYEEPEKSAVEKAIDDAKKAIDEAATVDEVNAAKKTAEDKIAEQKTKEQKDKEAAEEKAAKEAAEKKAAEEKAAKEAAEKKAARAKQKGKDGTALGAGASAEAAEKAILSSSSEEGPKGSKFASVALKSTKQGKNNIKLSWKKTKGAVKYVVYGNECGSKKKMKKLATTKSNKFNVRKISKKLRKGKYHKFIVVALDKNNNVISASKVIHVATKGGKVGNHKSVKVSKKVVANAKKLKKGKSLKLNAKTAAASKNLKVKKHRAISYETSNAKVATVSKKGVVKAKNKGTCYIYAYAQNGAFKRIKVTVK